MTKSELIHLVAEKNPNLTKTSVGEVLESTFETILEQAKLGQKVAWSGFGKFTLQKRTARDGRNPKTGESIKIAASEVLKFHASPATTTKIVAPVAPVAAPAKKKK